MNMVHTRFSLLLLAALLTAGLTAGLAAKENGKTGRTAASAGGCGSCHGSSSATTTLSVAGHQGSVTVKPGESISLDIVVAHSTAKVAGIDIDVATGPDGTTVGTLNAPTGGGLKLVGSELVHSTPRAFSGGSATFTMQWTAPSSAGTYLLRAVALAGNGNGSDDSGDDWARMATFQIIVKGDPPPPPPPSTATITIVNPAGGERYHPGDTISIRWDAVLSMIDVPVYGSNASLTMMSDDDESDDDESDDDESDDDESDDDESDDDESDDDSDDDDSDSTNTGGSDSTGTGGSDSTGTGGNDSTGNGGSDTTGVNLTGIIEWSSTGSNGPWMPIAQDIPLTDERYEWIAPSILTEDAWVRITRTDSLDVHAYNLAAFAIVAEDSSGSSSDSTGGPGDDDSDSAQVAMMNIAHPALDEVVLAGTAYLITWTSTTDPVVNIQYDQCGASWQTIATDVSASKGRLMWKVPANASGTAHVRIVAAADPNVVLEESDAFRITMPTGVDEGAAHDLLRVTPHPLVAGQPFNVGTDNTTDAMHDATVTLWSMSGESMYHMNLTDGAAPTLPSTLAPGPYALAISTSAGSITQLVIVIHQ